MVLFAPYVYNWALGNKVYKIDGLSSAQKTLGHDVFTSAFVIGNGTGGVHDNVTSSLADLKKFSSSGGTVILSVGGASGPFLEDSCTEDQMFFVLDGLINAVPTRHLDFDVEGSIIAMPQSTQKRNNVLARLKKKYSDLYVSVTLAVGLDGLTLDGVNLVKSMKLAGVGPDIVNCMLMDTYSAVKTTWGDAYCSVMDKVQTQLSTIYGAPTYSMLGLCPMIGRQDDNSTCTLSDVKQLAEYCAKNKCGLFSFWSLQRDQVGTGSLAIYSQVNKQDYEFFSAVKSILGTSDNGTKESASSSGANGVNGDDIVSEIFDMLKNSGLVI